jgi:hypothetical protein
MSCVVCGRSGCTAHVGYKGQRYEVRARGENGVGFPVGWTNQADGGAIAEMARIHPGWTDVRVIDLNPDAS